MQSSSLQRCRSMPSRTAVGLLARSSNRKFVATRAAYASAGLAATPAGLDHLVQRNVAYTFGYYARAAALSSSRYRRRLHQTIETHGAEHLAQAVDHGRGVILVSPHLGDLELAASFIAQVLGVRPVVPVAVVRPALRQLFYDRVRDACGFDLRRRTSLETLASDLSAGHAVSSCATGARLAEAPRSGSLVNEPSSRPRHTAWRCSLGRPF